MSARPSSRFLDLRALASLRHMRFSPRNRVEGSYTGRHRSRLKGGSGEFVDYREYSEGDDLRRLDWKVLGRTGRGYLRLHQEETNLVCMVMIDASESMRFGDDSPEGSKLQYSQYFATAMSHVIGNQQDQIGLAVVNDGLGHVMMPGGTAGHIAQLQSSVEAIETKPATSLEIGLRKLFERSRQRGVLMVLSDFLVDNLSSVFAAIRLFRHRHWDVIVMHTIHTGEERLPEGAAFRFQGMENDGASDCSPAEIASVYESRFKEHAAEVRSFALATGCNYRRVSTAIPYLRTLSEFLVERTG